MMWQMCKAWLFTVSPFRALLESTRQARFDRFAVGLNVCTYFYKGQAAEDLGTVPVSLETLRFLVFYSDVQTSKAPHLHIKNEYILCDGPIFL